MSHRHDVHAPSKFVPSDYTHLFSFKSASVSDGIAIYAINTEKLEDGHIGAPKANVHPDIFQCDCCGARYVYGDALFHKPTNEVITLGWQCADKYVPLSDHKAFKKMLAKVILQEKRKAWKKQGIEKARAFLKDQPELKAAFKAKHGVIASIRGQLLKWGRISQAQINCVIKIAKQEAEKAEEKAVLAEVKAEHFVPIGEHPERVEITGTLVKQYEKEGEWYSREVMIVEWDRENGKRSSIWGTAPSALFKAYFKVNEETGEYPEMIGAKVTFSAAVEQSEGADPTFGFFNKPTKFKVAEWGPKKA